MDDSLLGTRIGRRRLMQAALYIARGTHLEPRAAERALLAQFVRGSLTLDEVLARIDALPPASG